MTISLRAPYNKAQFQELIADAHECSGCSLRDLTALTNLTPGYISQILNGHRHPSRDALIVLCSCGWILSLEEINEILECAGHKALSPGERG
jgi:hypothetical protein